MRIRDATYDLRASVLEDPDEIQTLLGLFNAKYEAWIDQCQSFALTEENLPLVLLRLDPRVPTDA